MKIHLVTAEHFRDGGIIQKAFSTHDAAVAEAIALTSVMVGDSGWQSGDVNPATLNDFIERLQDYHGAAHCYVEVAEIEVAGEVPALTIMAEALEYEADQFDGPVDQDLSVSGADLVDWFTEWRMHARAALAQIGIAA